MTQKELDNLRKSYEEKKEASKIKIFKKFQQRSEERDAVRKVKYGLLGEAAANMQAMNDRNVPIDSDVYEKGMNNIRNLTQSAKSVHDIEEGENRMSTATIGAITGVLTSVALFACDFVFKHPISGGLRKVFRK